MKKTIAASVLALATAWTPLVWAQSAAPAATSTAQQATAEPAPSMTPEEVALLQKYNAILQSQKRQTGDVPIPGAAATLHLGEGYYFLGAADAKRVITEGWGNPPDAASNVLGMVFPAGKNFMDSWGAVVTYQQDGFVSDKDAGKIDAEKLLAQMREGEEADNEQRKKNGYGTLHVVGWAQSPSYDAKHHYVVWARDLRGSDAPEDSLNYDIRFLGRRGVLSVNMIDGMSNLDSVRAAADGLVETTKFDAGAGYGDYTSGDKKAEYGIAGLVAAGLGVAAAQKFGLLAVALLFLKKAAVLVLAAFAGLGAWIKNLFRRKPSAEASSE
jgi:uncharacterized membrane-anchored protein